MNMTHKQKTTKITMQNVSLQQTVEQILHCYKSIGSTVIGIGLSSVMLTGCVTNQTQTVQATAPSSIKPVTTISEITSHKSNTQTAKTDVTPDKINLELATQIHYSNIWDEMSHNFALADEHYGKYDHFLSFYNQRKTHLKLISERAKPYLYYILNEVKQRNMPLEIALLPAVESGFKAVARSNQSAVGLWQFIPSTGDLFNLHRNWWYDGRKDIVQSTTAALDYLQELYTSNNNDWLLALASYNAGLGNIYRAQRKYRKEHKTQPGIKDYQPDFWEIQKYLPKETQSYVPKLLSIAHIVENPEKFGVTLKPIDNQPFFKVFTLKKQVSLHQVARISKISSQTFRNLNPCYYQPATPPNGKHNILLPIKKSARFAQLLQSDSHLFKVHWKKHKIKSGDSLSVIAYRYKTSSRAIKKLNGMKNSKIRAGKTLLIPIPVDGSRVTGSNTILAKNSSTIKSVQTSHKSQQKHLAENQTNSSAKRKQIHTVKSGDSLWKLAKHYNTSIKQLASWNNLSPKSRLKQGQKLAIFTPISKTNKKIEHVLKSGESLWLLAKRYKVKTVQIAKWNNISTHKVLRPGMKLTIWSLAPQDLATKYIVKNGDNLWNIAKANQISATHLAKFNKLSLKTFLQPGQVLKIPASTATQEG